MKHHPDKQESFPAAKPSASFSVLFGGTPLGAPIVGWVADRFGPRWALGFGALSGFSALAAGLFYLATRPRER